MLFILAMEDNIIITLGNNSGINDLQLKKAVEDSNKVSALFKELGYKEYDIRVIPEEATPSNIRKLMESCLKSETNANLAFFYFSGFCAFMQDAEGNLLPNLALLTQNIKTAEQIPEALTLEDIFQSYFSIPSRKVCFVFDLCLLDCIWGGLSEEEVHQQMEAAAHIIAQLERMYYLSPHTILISIAKDVAHREDQNGGFYSNILLSTLEAMHRAELPICLTTAHQKARYALLQNGYLEGRIFSEIIYCISNCYLNYPKEVTSASSNEPEEELSEEEMMLEVLDDFDIIDDAPPKYEFEGRKFRDDADLIKNGLQDKTSWKIRAASAKKLGENRVEQAVPTLLLMMKETNYMVKRSVTEALGQIGTEEAFHVLKNVARPWPLGDPDEATTKIAQKAIKQIEGRRAEESGSFGNIRSGK